MNEGPIPLDFNVDKVQLGFLQTPVPKFVKAILRLSKMLTAERRKLALIYPDPVFLWTSLVVLEVYHYLARAMNSRTLPKILVMTDSLLAIKTYREVANEFRTPFVDYIYSGFIDGMGFHRIKPLGSSRGTLNTRISIGQTQVFFCKPSHLNTDLDYDFIVVENIQRMLRHPQFDALKTVLTRGRGLLGILTSPNPSTITRLENLGLQSWGWTEDTLSKQMAKFNDVKTTNQAEARFPAIDLANLHVDDKFRTLINLAHNSYWKTINLRKTLAIENPVVNRVLYELKFYLTRTLSMSVPLETLEETEKEIGRVPIRRRFEFTRNAISDLPTRIRESLELENSMNLCQSILSLQPPKWLFVEEYVKQSYKTVYITGIDDLSTKALEKQFRGKSTKPQVVSPKSPKRDAILHALVTGLTSSLYWNYRVLKAPNADRCTILAYEPEVLWMERLKTARASLSEMVKERMNLISTFKLEKY